MKSQTLLVRPLRSGQITLPVAFRRALGLDQASMLEITLQDGELRIRPHAPDKIDTGSDWLQDLHRLYWPARRSAAALEEDAINWLIDAIVTITLRRLR